MRRVAHPCGSMDPGPDEHERPGAETERSLVWAPKLAQVISPTLPETPGTGTLPENCPKTPLPWVSSKTDLGCCILGS